jgi:hypothetical protein
MWANSEIFTKLPKANSRRLGENSPNLVTLGIVPTSSSKVLHPRRKFQTQVCIYVVSYDREFQNLQKEKYPSAYKNLFLPIKRSSLLQHPRCRNGSW